MKETGDIISWCCKLSNQLVIALGSYKTKEFLVQLTYDTCSFFIGPESDHCLPLSLTHWLTDWLLFSKLDWCNPGVWRCQLKTCWCCNCCWWGSCWQQFVADFEAEVWSKNQTFELQLPNLKETVANTIHIINISNSTSFELASSHARVTSFKFTKQEWVSQLVS